jgi:hypothetical protein
MVYVVASSETTFSELLDVGTLLELLDTTELLELAGATELLDATELLEAAGTSPISGHL